MNTHTLWFCPLIRKLQALKILKWAQGSQWRNTTFYIFTAVKYSFFKICIILINIYLYFITLYIIEYCIALNVLKSGTLLFLFSNKVLVFRAGIHKTLIRETLIRLFLLDLFVIPRRSRRDIVLASSVCPFRPSVCLEPYLSTYRSDLIHS